MNKYFQIKNCPICSKKLKLFFDGKLRKYFCEEFYFRHSLFDEWNKFGYDKNTGKIKEPHYSVSFEGYTFTQSTIVPPYWIKTIGGTNRTKIYKFPPKIYKYSPTVLTNGNISPLVADDNELIMEIPAIIPSDYTPEAFVNKIKNLVIFI